MTKSPPLPFIIPVHGQETAITLSPAKYIGYKYPGARLSCTVGTSISTSLLPIFPGVIENPLTKKLFIRFMKH